MTVKTESSTLCLVAYYRTSEVVDGTLRTPSVDPHLWWMEPRSAIYSAITDRCGGRSGGSPGGLMLADTHAVPSCDVSGQVPQTL